VSKILQIAIFIFSSQVGSGVFILPAALCIVGYKALYILLIVGLVCTLITKIFAETGKNSYELIGDAFGNKAGKFFFTLYWIISWFSTVVLFKELVGYLGVGAKWGLLIEIFIWLSVTFYNMRSLRNILILEGLLTCLKILPFFGLFLCFLREANGIVTSSASINLSLFLRCLWSFVGLETGNIIAKNIQTNKREREWGTYLGMLAVIVFYLLSIFFSFKICGTAALLDNTAPYITVFQKGLGGYLNYSAISNIVKYTIMVVLIGSINSWTISSGYTGYEGGMLNILPKYFTKINKDKVPYMSILLSYFWFCHVMRIYMLQL
jgi:amino acid transporter